MNFFEAYLEAKNGKKVTICGVHDWWLQLNNCVSLYDGNSFDMYTKDGRSEYSFNNKMIAHWLNCDWQIYEEPKESKGLWEKPAHENSVYFGLRLGGNLHKFSGESDAFRWGKALNTFMLLKGHPLAIPFDNSKLRVHYCIFHNPNGLNHKDIGVHLGMAGQGTQNISPSFSNFDDANQALKDIGPENLLHMFKTFSGIYE